MSDETYDDLLDGSRAELPAASGTLVLVSTPIGNLGDMTARGTAALREADLILCEDTRHTARLLSALGIGGRLRSLHEHNEDARTGPTLDLLRAGKRVVLVSDAGTPVISDPGFRLVRASLAAGLRVTAVPGPNAAISALVLSGLPPHPFLFLGFPAARRAARQTAFQRLRGAERAGLSATLIWHEAPHRLPETLEDMAAVFGPRPAAVARELTKQFEEVRRAPLPELASHYAAETARGEVTVVVGPASGDVEEPADLDAQLRAALSHQSLKDAVAEVVAATGLSRKLVYARALALSGEEG
ncbi:MAG: 16S rRNA (cytidine(1402)-2'-O)-methyltransferase [Acetobacteraceae bacterium]|nr:16S rRNA (cytidine(1402)-2'-O)-methyltransferase [Acetobacteraceae bacterium]